jgi:LuxR family maltose regulon positive regulatory protein
MDFILTHLPPQMQLVLVTRTDPPLHLTRLRGQGRLTELRMGDLRFSQDETLAFFAKFFKGEIAEEDILRLFTRTEGWITGLQMAAISMQDREDISEFVRSFSGTHHYILDYLLEEALKQQPEEVQAFLIQTSILERLTGTLCNVVTGREGSHAILDRLEKANLFIMPLDEERRWFRYHRLFADLLQVRLHQVYGNQIADLHRKASQWYEQNGLISRAIDHALLAEDFERAIRLMEGEAEGTLMRSEISTFLRWANKLPDSLITEHPNMNFLFAWGLMLKGHNLDEVLTRVDKIEDTQGWLVGRKETLLAFIALSQVNMNKGGEHASRALKLLQEDDTYFWNIAIWINGVSGASKQNLEGAGKVYKDLLVVFREQGTTMLTVMTASQLGRLQTRLGKLREAEATLMEALEASRDRQGNLLPIAGEALMGMGELFLEMNELDKANDYLLEGIEFTRHWRDVAAMDGYITLALVKQAQGKEEDAQDAIDKAMKLALKYDATDIDDRMVELWQARLWVAQGKLDLAMKWAENLQWKGIGDFENIKTLDDINYQFVIRESVIVTRLKYLQGQYLDALKWLERQIPIFIGLGRLISVTELHLLKALVHEGLGEKGQAISDLKAALEIAESAGFLRVFLDQGPALKHLLHRAKSQNIHLKYIDRVLNAFTGPVILGKGEPQPLVDPLSERELDILRRLRTNLTTPEIADEMVIGVNTVRTHIKNIYSKLAVHKRSEAVSRAKDLGLL